MHVRSLASSGEDAFLKPGKDAGGAQVFFG
jgi:hypothetical protein